MFQKKLMAGALGVLALTTATTAQADDHMYERPWDLTLGAITLFSPEYKGSDETETRVLPMVEASYYLDEQRSLFFGMKDGLGYNYSYNDMLDAGVAVHYRSGRDSSDDTFLAGMEDLDDAAELNAYVSMKNGPFNAGVELSKGVTGDNGGLQLRLNAGADKKLAKKLRGGLGVSVAYSDDEYMEDYFSVSAAEATAGRAAYDAGSGFSEAEFSGNLIYMHDKHHMGMLNASYGVLMGDAGDSSLTQDESYFSAVIGYGYRF